MNEHFNSPDDHSSPLTDSLSAFRLDGKVALVTGGSSGLGARAARVLDSLGASVVVAARRTELIEDVAESLRAGRGVTCDVSQRGASAALVDDVLEHEGRLDVVVVCAGIHNVELALRETMDRFVETIEIDLIAAFELAQASARAMRVNNEGSILHVATAAAFRRTQFAPQAGYAAAKVGLLGLTYDLAMQWGRYGIRVNALCPGMFDTDLTSDFMAAEDERKRFEDEVALKRIGRPEELDAAIAFLASPASSYVTGQALTIDGGWSL
jgi:NAD(P)-dependent dehydrogenase (short-subunit alcohol dehydrogenase family)